MNSREYPVAPINQQTLAARLELADQLLAGRVTMLDPQDLPSRYGRVVDAIDRVLRAVGCQAVMAGGWAVWRHGYLGRVTQDVDIVLAATDVEGFLQTASVSGFDVLATAKRSWPKLLHKETQIEVDILPEGARPGVVARPAPTVIRHPGEMGAAGTALRYITLPSLIELKIAAGRARDEADIIELLRVNDDQIDAIQTHLKSVNLDYADAFERLVERAREQEDR